MLDIMPEKGDKIECITEGIEGLTKGNLYEIIHRGGNHAVVKGDDDMRVIITKTDADKFKLIEGMSEVDHVRRYKELEQDYIEDKLIYGELEREYRNILMITDQIWDNPTHEPIPDDIKITVEEAHKIIKNMEKIIKEGTQ